MPKWVGEALTGVLGIQNGFGLHIWDIKHMTKEKALFQTKLLLYIAELMYASALFFAKASILSFYWRMFRVTNIKLPIQILFTCAVIWIIIRVSSHKHLQKQPS